MIPLSAVVDLDDFYASVNDGFIRLTGSAAGLTVANYTDRCTWDRAWTPTTLACRGLIFDEQQRVVARPFPKFFNHGEPNAPAIPLHDYVVTTDKVDGSLGILYPSPFGGYSIATRGSLTSEQALVGSLIWKSKYAGRFTPNPSWTYLFEIVYPDNRIVLDYGDQRDLILLGAVDIATGRSVNPTAAALGWPGPAAETLSHPTLASALSAPPREGREGMVVWHPATDSRVKLKQEDYLRLHKLLTGVSERDIWEVMLRHEDPCDVYADTPDEFHEWIESVRVAITLRLGTLLSDVFYEYNLPEFKPRDGEPRGEYAARIHGHTYAPFFFRLLDGKSIWEMAMKKIRPNKTTTMTMDKEAA